MLKLCHFWWGFQVVLELLIWTLIAHCIPYIYIYIFFTFYAALPCKCKALIQWVAWKAPPVSLHPRGKAPVHIISDADMAATAKPLDEHVQHIVWGIPRLKRCVPNRIFPFYFSSGQCCPKPRTAVLHLLQVVTFWAATFSFSFTTFLNYKQMVKTA